MRSSKTSFKHIGLIGKQNHPDIKKLLEGVQTYLRAQGITTIIMENIPYSSAISPPLQETIGENADLVIIFGGDGTFLSAARAFHRFQIPLLGVNLGRLGFLADLPQDQCMAVLSDILQGQFIEESRLMLAANLLHPTLVNSNQTSNRQHCSLALNEVVIHQANIARMIELDVFVNEQLLTSYWADGLIISTPTGSTAYALSTGGPLIAPNVNALLVAPICPHTLSQRPIVLPETARLRIQLRNPDDVNVNVTCDGQVVMPFFPEQSLVINAHPQALRLLHPQHYNYFEILRAKLNWGTHPIRER